MCRRARTLVGIAVRYAHIRECLSSLSAPTHLLGFWKNFCAKISPYSLQLYCMVMVGSELAPQAAPRTTFITISLSSSFQSSKF